MKRTMRVPTAACVFTLASALATAQDARILLLPGDAGPVVQIQGAADPEEWVFREPTPGLPNR